MDNISVCHKYSKVHIRLNSQLISTEFAVNLLLTRNVPVDQPDFSFYFGQSLFRTWAQTAFQSFPFFSSYLRMMPVYKRSAGLCTAVNKKTLYCCFSISATYCQSVDLHFYSVCLLFWFRPVIYNIHNQLLG